MALKWKEGGWEALLPNDVVDDNGVWMLQQPSQLHGNLGETKSAATEDLESTKGSVMPLRAQREVDHPRVSAENVARNLPRGAVEQGAGPGWRGAGRTAASSPGGSTGCS